MKTLWLTKGLFAGLLLCLTKIALADEIDGELDEAHWSDAVSFNRFKISEPLTFTEPDNLTQVLVTSDEKGIYVGFINQQAEGESVKSRSLRDATIEDDYNEVIIDFDAQAVRAFGFKISRSGAIQDAIWNDQNRESIDWDGEWQAAVEVNDDDWTSEIFIPWSIVSMLTQDTKTRHIKLYFSRWHQGKQSRFSFPAIDRSQTQFMRNFHSLELLFTSVSSIDFFPYVSLNQDLEHDKSETRAGLDVFWKPTSAQQLNLTLNPDFGQVESDDLVVNFSAVETFFSEKRPFFRENHDLFDMQGPQNLRLVHTPRIGGESDDEEISANTIDFAARYNFIGDKLDIGVLSAQEDDTVLLRGRDYLALRGKVKFEEGSFGVLQTETQTPSQKRIAEVSAVDFEFEFFENTSLTGQYIKTQITKDLTTSEDKGWWIASEWEPSDKQSHELTYMQLGQFLDLTDLAFIERVNRKQWLYEGSYRWAEFDGVLRDIELEWLLESKNNAQNHELPFALEIALIGVLDSTQGFEIELEHLDSGIDDLITRGNNPVYLPAATKVSLKYLSAKDSRWSYELDMAFGKEFLDGDVMEFEFSPNYQWRDNLNIGLGLEWEKADSWLIWDEVNLLEEFSRDELTLAINIGAVFNSHHEFRLKLEAVALEAVALNEYTVDALGNISINDEPPDSFSLSEFAMQFRYRYQLSALSEFYFVYSRGGEFEQEQLGFSRSSLITQAARNDDSENLLVKLKLHF